MPGIQSPEQPKISHNPAIQDRVQKKAMVIAEKYPDAKETHIIAAARSAVAGDIRIEKLHKELQKGKEFSYIDMLTGLKNRRWFDEDLRKRTRLYSRENINTQLPFNQEDMPVNKKRLALIMIDADKFKQVNDGYGHSTGDNILRLFGQLLTRPNEEISRYGGEEFAQLIEIDEDKTVEEVVETVLSRYSTYIKEHSRPVLRDRPIQDSYNGEGPQRELSLSYGVSLYTPGENSADFLRRADQALYESKKNRDTGTIAYETFLDNTRTNVYKPIYSGAVSRAA